MPGNPTDLPRGRLARWREHARRSGVRFWLTLFGLGCLRLMQVLPFRLQLAVGAGFGWLTWLVAAKPRRIVQKNIAAYFADRPPAERRRLVRRSFQSLGMTVVESPFGWWASDARLARRYTIEGLEYLDRPGDGRGTLLLGFHFTTVELCGLMLCRNFSELCAVYRPYRKNPLADEFTRHHRSRFAREMIDRGDLHTIARRLRRGETVFFAGDQIVRAGKRSEVLPFFGVPTLFHSGWFDLVRMTDARVVPYLPQRLPGGRYRIEILPPLDIDPADDRRAAMTRVNALLEDYVRRDPTQYLWARDRLA